MNKDFTITLTKPGVYGVESTRRHCGSTLLWSTS